MVGSTQPAYIQRTQHSVILCMQACAMTLMLHNRAQFQKYSRKTRALKWILMPTAAS